MLEYIKDLLFSRGIDTVGALPLSACRIIRPYKLERCNSGKSDSLFAVVFAIPYYTHHGKRNLSSYAIPRDYHLFCKELFSEILPILRSGYPEYTFEGFADDSPIDEISAAALAGLGIIGRNRLLITPKYSSYVFLGEIITDAPINVPSDLKIEYCEDCGRCQELCPMHKCGVCLSGVTQKKGELTDKEKQLIQQYLSIWGCDICQEVCPHTLRAINAGTIFTNIDFFKSELIPVLSKERLDQMSESDFSKRAYSWRGINTIKRNICLINEKTKEI